MADAVDALVDAMERAFLDPPLDRPPGEASREQLAHGDHAVLAPGEARYPSVR